MPQLLSGFGLLGIALGTTAAVLVPLVGYLFSAGNGAAELRDKVDTLADSVSAYQDAVDASNQSTAAMRIAFGDAAGAIDGTLQLLQQIAASDAQAAIDEVTNSLAQLLGTGGDGDARAELANFFDVNIMLAFTDAQRQAREEARLLTSQFQSQQQALASSEGNLDAQIEALANLLQTTRQLAQATDGVNDEEKELIQSMRDALLAMIDQKRAMGEVKSGIDAAKVRRLPCLEQRLIRDGFLALFRKLIRCITRLLRQRALMQLCLGKAQTIISALLKTAGLMQLRGQGMRQLLGGRSLA
ncbi:MAG: hypothetical protein U5N55_03595 [Cypionkella sp.]|nr:hypothetical protein [Cypionkella sp.]